MPCAPVPLSIWILFRLVFGRLEAVRSGFVLGLTLDYHDGIIADTAKNVINALRRTVRCVIATYNDAFIHEGTMFGNRTWLPVRFSHSRNDVSPARVGFSRQGQIIPALELNYFATFTANEISTFKTYYSNTDKKYYNTSSHFEKETHTSNCFLQTELFSFGFDAACSSRIFSVCQ